MKKSNQSKMYFLLLILLAKNPACASYIDIKDLKIGAYDSNIYFIKDVEGKTKAKLALISAEKKGEYYYTTGGVTGKESDLIDFFIPVYDPTKAHNDISKLKLRIKSDENNSNSVCNQLSFYFEQNKIKIENGNIHLDTATSCNYNIFNSKGVKISSFYLLLNHTYNYWCNNTNESSEAYKTARVLSPTCSITEKAYYIRFDGKRLLDLSPLSGFIYLQTLMLDNNDISNLPLGLFDKLYYLKILFLNNNKIKNLHHNLFKKNKYLEMLVIDKNQISKIEANIFAKSNNLWFLSLGNNLFTDESISRTLFEQLPNLSTLVLNGNQFTKIPENILKIKTLVSLNLSGNKISEIPDELFNLKSLVNLRLQNNKINRIPSWVFSPLWMIGKPNFYDLDLSNNQISELPQDEFYNMSYLIRVNLSGNPLTIPVVTSF